MSKFAAMKLRLLAPLMLALALLPACKKKYDFETKTPATGGVAEVVLEMDDTGNGEITLEFEFLAPPAEIDGTLKAYVVWTQVAGKDPTKLGVVEYKEKKRSGSLTATYSAKQFKLIVTVEADPSVTAPVGARVLEADVVAPKG
jgi:hypothetical protein